VIHVVEKFSAFLFERYIRLRINLYDPYSPSYSSILKTNMRRHGARIENINKDTQDDSKIRGQLDARP
jgi:hypothetical protein